MTPAGKAAQALRDAADALAALPVVYRRINSGPAGGYAVPVERLRCEADYIEAVAAAVTDAHDMRNAS